MTTQLPLNRRDQTPDSLALPLPTAFTEFLLAKDHTDATRRYYRVHLKPFWAWAARQTPPVTTTAALSAPLLRRFIDERKQTPNQRTGEPLSSYTVYTEVRGLLAFLNWLAAEDVIDPKVPARVKPPRREQKVLRVLDKRQIDRLFLSAEQGLTAARDRAILSVLLDTGLRARELCGLTRADVHISPDEGYLLVRHGKGRRQREVPLGKKARFALARYLRTHAADAVFIGTNKGPNVPLTPSGLDQILYALVDRTGRRHFADLKLGAHLYRHTFAVSYLDAGGDIYRLSRIMGHSQVTTTEGYLRAFTATQARRGSISPLDKLGA